jgi:hypothetical protein
VQIYARLEKFKGVGTVTFKKGPLSPERVRDVAVRHIFTLFKAILVKLYALQYLGVLFGCKKKIFNGRDN